MVRPSYKMYDNLVLYIVPKAKVLYVSDTYCTLDNSCPAPSDLVSFDTGSSLLPFQFPALGTTGAYRAAEWGRGPRPPEQTHDREQPMKRFLCYESSALLQEEGLPGSPAKLNCSEKMRPPPWRWLMMSLSLSAEMSAPISGV